VVKLALLTFVGLATASLNAQFIPAEIHPDGKGGGTIRNHGGSDVSDVSQTAAVIGRATTNGISYHGGPVMLGTTNIHFIYYGNWTANSKLTGAQTILADWASHIGGSGYYNINTTYFNGSNQHVSNSVAFAGAVSVGSPLGNNLSDANLTTVVANTHPTDPNGVYFVLTSPEVNETSGFCTQYCGFHTHATIGGQDIKYAFVGDAGGRCPSACAAQTNTPNGNIDADTMANTMSHEFEESTSDPDLNAWFDSRGNENADKCNFNFGATFAAPNGSRANQTFGTRNYLIQQNWLNANGGLCVQHNP
jgi:hypothetical protein